MGQHVFNLDTVTVTIDLPAADEAVLADQVISNDDWLRGFANMVQAKINRIRGTIADKEMREAAATGTLNQLPASRNEIVAAVFARPGYKNRAGREAAEADSVTV